MRQQLLFIGKEWQFHLFQLIYFTKLPWCSIVVEQSNEATKPALPLGF
jgi:hypothetical protein